MEIIEAFNTDMASGPQWVPVWVMFMGLVFMLAIPFAFSRPEARWALVCMALTFPAMMWFYSQVGYVRLLGLVHVIFWTPLLVYLWMRRAQWDVRNTLAGKWIALLFTTILASLIIDYIDVLRYIAGDRS